ncbi:MAG: hypothetical protein EXR18_02760 [Flavobacteriaceae bacterium]|nr:hypothetical protein [Flavobacteriaceae bacterium]
MKRFFGLLFCSFLFNSCDDGNIKFDTFNFDPAVAINSCSVNNGLFFKVKNNEALILQTPISTFANLVTTANTPRTILVSSTNKVVYRLFNTIISNAYFCSLLPPASPTVSDEWNAAAGVIGTSGIIEVTTTETLNPTTQVLTGYNHYVVFKNITFSNGINSFTYAQYVYGNFVTSI